MLDKVTRYYRTIKYLKAGQIYAQIRFRLRSLLGLKSKLVEYLGDEETSCDPQLVPSIPSNRSFFGNNTFSFLNITKTFDREIDWSYKNHGKLWCYNLNYFQFLMQDKFTKEEGMILIDSWMECASELEDGLEPYPTSVRIINWIKYLEKFGITDQKVNNSLKSQLVMLSKNIEYHLMGNHLLENGFALYYGGAATNNLKIFKLGEQIVLRELEEQILQDGGHFERSPMYHSILLERVLDCINLSEHKSDSQFIKSRSTLKNVASKMIQWLTLMTFRNGEMPSVNDATAKIGPSYFALLDYTNRLGISPGANGLSDSGYRKVSQDRYELLIDVGNIGPDYIPGHGHSDCLSFLLCHNSEPVVVDTGISTYENNDRRRLERSTAAHNTVVVDDTNQSEVWGSFRVGRRAKIQELFESENYIQANHDGYQHIGGQHSRSFRWSESLVIIEDKVICKSVAQAYFHFHPNVEINLSGSTVTADFGSMEFNNYSEIKLSNYQFAEGYNKLENAPLIIVKFSNRLVTKMILK